MFIIGNFLIGLGQLLGTVIHIYVFIIIAVAIISWVNPDPFNPIVRFLYGVTDPVLRPIRRFIPVVGGIDVSPIVAILLLEFARYFVVGSLIELGVRLK
jgi:YggT family protein